MNLTQAIVSLMERTTETAQQALPRTTYSRELIDLLFVQPYVKIENMVNHDIAERRTASKYLKQLEQIGILGSYKAWKETIYITSGRPTMPIQRTNKYMERMEACMRVRNLSSSTQERYKLGVLFLVEYHQKPPEEITESEVTDSFIHLRDERKLSPSSINVYHAALKFLFNNILGREGVVKAWQNPRRKYSHPAVCSRSEIITLLKSVESIVYQTIFLVMYGAGLRVGEAVTIKVEDIDSESMVIRVRNGKGGIDRAAKMCEVLLYALREYWKRVRPPKPYLFPGRTPDTHISKEAVGNVLRSVAQQCEFKIRVTPHTLRHSFVTHLLQAGVDVRIIQDLLGHRSIKSTQIYTHVTPEHVRGVKGPLQLLQMDPKGMSQ